MTTSQALFANNAATTLTSAAGPTTTTLQVASGVGFPTPGAGQFFAIYMTDAATKSQHEVIYVTTNAANQFTVLRGQEGTTAQSWVIGDIVQHVVTAGVLASFEQINGARDITANHTLTASDNNATLNVTAANVVIILPTGLFAGFTSAVSAFSTGITFTLQSPATLAGNGSVGLTSFALLQNFRYQVTYDGANWQLSGQVGNFAALNGNAAENFEVAPATTANQAVALEQVLGQAPVLASSSQGITLAAYQTYTETTSPFNAPAAGWLTATAALNLGELAAHAVTATLYINGTQVAQDTSPLPMTLIGTITVPVNTPCFAELAVVTTTDPACTATLRVRLSFTPNP